MPWQAGYTPAWTDSITCSTRSSLSLSLGCPADCTDRYLSDLGLVSWRPTTVKWRQSSQSNRHSTIGTPQTEYREALPSSANDQVKCDCTFAYDGNVSWNSGLWSADGGMTVGLWRLSSLDGRRPPWYRPQISAFDQKGILPGRLWFGHVSQLCQTGLRFKQCHTTPGGNASASRAVDPAMEARFHMSHFKTGTL